MVFLTSGLLPSLLVLPTQLGLVETRNLQILPPNDQSPPNEILAWQLYHMVRTVANYDPTRVVFGR